MWTVTNVFRRLSHDRYFLDNVADWILEIDRGELYPFKGNYTQWLDYKRRPRYGEEAGGARARMIDRELEWMNGAGARRSKSKVRGAIDLSSIPVIVTANIRPMCECRVLFVCRHALLRLRNCMLSSKRHARPRRGH